MLLLPIAALAVMAFFFILLMLTAGSLEQREQQRLPWPPERMFCGLSLSPGNENARLVWATQLPILERLASSSGLLPEALRSGYAAMARRYPALYEGRRFEEWLQFLEKCQVVRYWRGRLQLAAYGQAVLDQCRSAYGRDSHSPH